MPEPNNPDYFPELRFGTLQKNAQDWATFLKINFDIPSLKNITLYNTPPFPFPFHKRKYLIFFEFPYVQPDEYYYLWYHCRFLGEADHAERQLFFILRTYMHNPAWRPAMFRNFQEVYKEGKGPGEDALEDWRFGDPLKEWYFSFGMRIDLTPEPWLDSLDKDHCWILYERGKTTHALPEPVAEVQEQNQCAIFNFYKKGYVWALGEAGKEPTLLNHLVGLGEIHFLLLNEGVQYKPESLYSHAGNSLTGSRAKKDGVDPTTISKAITSALNKIKNTPGLECLIDYLNLERLRTGAKGTYKYSPDPAKTVQWNLDAPS